MAKRGLNIYKRKDGRWEGRIKMYVSRNETGKYRSVYGRSYKEVKEKMAVLATEQGKKTDEKECTLTVREIVDIWIKDKKGTWKESTQACYRQIAERHISGGIGGQRADSFTNAAFHTFLDGIKKKSDGLKISSAYADSIGTVLRQAFAHGASEHHYALPKLKCRRMPRTGRVLEVPSESAMDTLTRYLSRHTDNSTCMGILLACCTGIRIGELCALTWKDVDLEEGVLKVSRNMQRVKEYGDGACGTRVMVQSPKTPTSRRCIPIPDHMLRILRENQGTAEEYLVRGRRKAWAEARTMQYRFAALLKKCGIKPFRFHAIRHYFASHCIRQGFDVKSLSEILGHVNTQITLNLYVHSSMDQKRTLMNKAFCGEERH